MSRAGRSAGERSGGRTGGRPPARGPEPGTYQLDHQVAELSRDLDVTDGWLLTLDGVPHSYVDLGDPTNLQFEYVAWLGDLVDLLGPEGEPLDTVHLGGGAATLARYVAATRPGSHQVVFEHDAALVELVRTALRLETGPRLRLRALEARAGAARLPAARYDLVVRDAFTGSTVPPHLATVEFAAEAARLLRTGGVYVLNLADRGPLREVRAEAATLRAVFRHVALVTEPAVLRGRRYGNALLVAADDELPLDDLARRVARGAAPARVQGPDAVRDLAGSARPRTDAELEPPPDGAGEPAAPDAAADPSAPPRWSELGHGIRVSRGRADGPGG